MFAAGTILLSYIAPVNESVGALWPEYQFDWLWLSILLFFSTPILFGSYICRALRLAVVFHPRAKRRLPWLIPVAIRARSPLGFLSSLFFVCCFFLVVSLGFVRAFVRKPRTSCAVG